MFPAAGILIFLPNVEQSGGFVASQMAMVLSCVFVGFALHRYADRGFRKKIQIDPSSGEIRIGTINQKERFHLKVSYPLERLESLFIVRSYTPGIPSKLMMRMKQGDQSVVLVTGTETRLVPILERASMFLRPKASAQGRVRTKRDGRFLRVAFS